MCKVCDHERNIVVCRELTKKFEDVRRGTLKEVAAHFSMVARVKGEIVLLLGPGQTEAFTGLKIENIIIDAMKFMSFKDSVNFVSKHLNISKKIVYKKALEIKNIT